jgi:hypothetical protein
MSDTGPLRGDLTLVDEIKGFERGLQLFVGKRPLAMPAAPGTIVSVQFG